MKFLHVTMRMGAGFGAVLWLGMVLHAEAQSKSLQPAVRLTVADKIVSEEKGAKQQLPRGNMQTRSTGVSQIITVQRMDATLPDQMVAEWLVVIETVEGKQIPVDYGTQDIELPFGRPAEVVTPAVTLMGREWGGKRRGSVSDQIVGVAVRIRKADGTIVAERYQPKTIELKVDDWVEECKKTGKESDRIKIRKGLLRKDIPVWPPNPPNPPESPR